MKFAERIFYVGGSFMLIVMLKQVSSYSLDYDITESENEMRDRFEVPPSLMARSVAENNALGVDNETFTPPVSTQEFKGPAGWLRICQPAGKYVGAVSSGKKECPAGYWFKDTIKVGCACGHGVWIFAKGWCDHTARIIVAKNGSCFNVNKDVKYIRNIGWSNSAFMPYHFVGTSGLEYIQDVPLAMTLGGTATNFHPEYHQHIGAIFRSRGVESLTGRFCLSQAGNVSRPLSFKYFVPKLPYLEKKNCFAYANQDLSNSEYDAGYEMNEGLTLTDDITRPFQKPKTWATEAENNNCIAECPSAYALSLIVPKGRSLGPDYIDPTHEFMMEIDATVKPNGTVKPTTAKPKKKYQLTSKTMVEIQEQTKRILRLNIKSSVRNLAAPNVKYLDYKLMQKARTILHKVCPETELPVTVLIGMHRMFRIALNESFFHYPFNQLGDDAETHRIWTVLNKCLASAKPMNFLYNNETNGSTEAKCEIGKFLGINYEFQTDTTVVNRTIIAKLPRHLWSNITKLDLAVETAWKTVMFSHYYCSRHFKESSLDFSRFEQKMERFFNRWIQHRWFYPGLAVRGYKYSFQMFDLPRYSVALDKCVAAARSFSLYRKWIRRPTYSKHIGGRLFEEQIEIPDDVAGRTSLDAINPKLNQFNKRAYCLPYWHAPVSNPGLNYNPKEDYKPGCIKYVKEEWLDPFSPTIGKSTGWRNTADIL